MRGEALDTVGTDLFAALEVAGQAAAQLPNAVERDVLLALIANHPLVGKAGNRGGCRGGQQQWELQCAKCLLEDGIPRGIRD
jgi:hypothetical protein